MSREHLHRRWLHSHEEDTETEMVFRPAGFAFPRSRGRSGFELRPDETFVDIGIAAADGPREADGRWEVEEGELLTIRLLPARGESRILHVAKAEEDRLVVRKPVR